MSTFQLFLLCVTLLTIVSIVAGTFKRPADPEVAFEPDPFLLVLGSRVVIHLPEGQALEGAVVNDVPLQLEDATLRTGPTGTAMKGVVTVPEGQVVLIQQLTAPRQLALAPDAPTEVRPRESEARA